MLEKLPTIIAADGTPITMVRISEEEISDKNYNTITANIAAQLLHKGETKTQEAKINDHFSTQSVEDSMIVQSRFFTEPYLLAFHRNETIGCAGVQPYRINPEGTQEGVGEAHETKMGIYRKGNNIHVVITPANFEVDNSAIEGAHLIDPSDLELVEYTINPFNCVRALERVMEKDKSLSVKLHFNDFAMRKSGFIYNNNGNNLYSVVTTADEYANAIDKAFGDLKQKFLERVIINSEAEKAANLENVIREEVGKVDINMEAVYQHGIDALPGNVYDKMIAGRDSGDSMMARVIDRGFNKYKPSFKGGVKSVAPTPLTPLSATSSTLEGSLSDSGFHEMKAKLADSRGKTSAEQNTPVTNPAISKDPDLAARAVRINPNQTGNVHNL